MLPNISCTYYESHVCMLYFATITLAYNGTLSGAIGAQVQSLRANILQLLDAHLNQIP